MQNPNNIFGAIYRISAIDRIFLSKEYAKDRIFSIVASNSPNDLSELAAELNELYDITDKQSLYEAIKGYDSTEFETILLNLLFRAKDELGDKFSELNFGKFNLVYANDNSLKSALEVFKIKPNDDDFKTYKADFENFAKFFFGIGEDASDQIPKFAKFYDATKEISALCKGTTIAAFDYARIVQIATGGYALGYLNEQEFLEIFTLYTEMTKKIFKGFDEFIASFLLGRAFMNFFERDEFIDEGLIFRANTFYIALNSPFDMFKESGIWTENLDEQKARISKILENLIDLNEYKNAQNEMESLKSGLENELLSHQSDIKKFEKALDCYLANFHYVLKDGGVEFIFNDFVIENAIFTPLHELTDEFSFCTNVEKFLNKTKIKLADDEWAIMVILRGDNTLVTNKGFYVQSGFMFMKKVNFYPHKDVKFRAVLDGTGDLKCFINNKEKFLIDFGAYAKAAGKKISLTEDEQNAKDFKGEIDAFTLAFDKLIGALEA
ncbi:DUF1266 domain-containing protein [Campylobacter gastrosuis]|uniref:DUF1266 domain-containing protein n=1 Tax=Campylobacter gastrosuis TaxID=2974576 RepID=A0ABT7HSH0_9BACT|nr:DUF1266 domain-containing protein [Campylobacter gastrosuis]MDL0089872.1 DUF1266 domain-containing protein [Campylobacter gastrosuis]